jgi:hypothetical protein
VLIRSLTKASRRARARRSRFQSVAGKRERPSMKTKTTKKTTTPKLADKGKKKLKILAPGELISVAGGQIVAEQC